MRLTVGRSERCPIVKYSILERIDLAELRVLASAGQLGTDRGQVLFPLPLDPRSVMPSKVPYRGDRRKDSRLIKREDATMPTGSGESSGCA